MAKCLVLGANGFIGSHLVNSLVDRGYEVRAFDRDLAKIKYSAKDTVDFFQGNFLNKHDLDLALEGVDYVFHFISTTTPASAEEDPLIDVETNVRMSIELFGLCADHNVKKIIFASTGGSIYGDTLKELKTEDDLPLPVSPYAIGKLTIEQYLRYFKIKFNLDYLTVRISNPYGEFQALHAKQGVIPIFLERVINDEPIVIYGDGSMERDYIYVQDVAEIVAEIFDKPAKYTTYNVGSGEAENINQILKAIEETTGKKVKIEYKETPSTFVKRVALDVSRLRQDFGMTASTPLDEGIKKTYDYLKKELAREQAEA